MSVQDKQFVSRVDCILLDIGKDVIKVTTENKDKEEIFSILLGNLKLFEYQRLVNSLNKMISLLIIDGRVVDVFPIN